MEAFKPSSYAGAYRIVSALRQDAGLRDEDILRRVHGPISERSAFLDAGGPALFMLQLEEHESQTRPMENPVEYSLVSALEGVSADTPLLDLGVRGLDAVAFVPALRTAEAKLVQPQESLPVALHLPYRFLYSLPPPFRMESLHDVPPPWWSKPLGPPATVRLEIPRDPPQNPRLRALDVVGADALGRAIGSCEVTLQADGTLVPPQSREGQEAVRWRFLLSSEQPPRRIAVTLSNCDLGFLDVFDAYAAQ